MRALGYYKGAQRSLEGDLVISFTVENEDVLQELDIDKRLVIETKKYSEKRSLNANAYFWVLCDLIAQKLGTTKDAVYLMQLSHYGFSMYKEVLREAVPEIRQMFRLVEELDDVHEAVTDKGEIVEAVTIRCYLGSSHYTKSEMSRLIDGTVQEAKDLGISVWSDEEIERLIKEWRAR